MANPLISKKSALCDLLDALKHHDEKLNNFLANGGVNLVAYFSHNDLDHTAQHVLLVLDAFAITNWV